VPRKLLTIKAAAAALVAVLSLGGVAAAAGGLLPDQASPVADQAPATTGADAAAHGLGKAAANLGGTTQTGSADSQGRASAAGPDASGAARAGLCRAWQAGQGADHGSRMDAVAFQALWRPRVGPTTSPPTARTWPPAPAPTPTERARRRRRTCRPRRPASRHRPGPPTDPGPPASTGPGGHGGPPTTTG
jgi:hypothetical protein